MPGARRVPVRVLVAVTAVLVLGPTACAGEPAGPPPAPVSEAPSPRAATAPSAQAPADPAAACVDSVVGNMDTRERAAQLVMVGVPADGLTAAGREALGEGAGGVILTDAAGGEASRAQVTATTREVQDTARVPVTVAVDQEGGKVQDLKGDGFTRIPAAVTQGRDPAGLRADARGWGEEMSGAGVTLDLAPVADVVDPDLGEANEPVGALDRGFGTDPARVSDAVTAFVEGLDQGGVHATLKHFPGLGRVRENTDFAGAADTRTGVDDPGLASFRAGIAAGAPVVMMSSAVYERIDPDNRALFSRAVITDLLRGRLGFDGVVSTDDVGAAAAVTDVPVGQRATRFVAAGGDQVLTIEASDLGPMVEALTAEADDDPAFARRLEESARRVLTLKSDRGILRCAP
ncbi:glycoside hydrolase family 3 N-terminal domain-containing protein [Actinomycetospora sp. NBC_00405]|uniref:glycoside hydrolase family 3 N-terminal domain-containing protein n=1 Tax=Actinomycetospora sp. NBC_00405 TaxID=2975952 RepID=UPI002E215290